MKMEGSVEKYSESANIEVTNMLAFKSCTVVKYVGTKATPALKHHVNVACENNVAWYKQTVSDLDLGVERANSVDQVI
jgi:hypothetical protein